MRWTIYKSSGLATFVSVVGALVCYAGIMLLFAKEFLAAIICIVIGFAIQMGAEEIARNATFKKWKNEVVSKGYAQLIAQGDYSVAVQLYNQNPGEKTMEFFKTLNPQIAAKIAASIQSTQAQKAASTGSQTAPSEAKSAPRPVQPVQPAPAESKPAPRPVQPVQPAPAESKPAPRPTQPVQTAAAPDTVNKPIELPSQLPRAERCAGCGEEIAPNSKFCIQCGAKVDREKRCVRCGAKLVEGAKFCGKCGQKIQ